MTKKERRKEAVALKYDVDTTTAPVVVAKGKGQYFTEGERPRRPDSRGSDPRPTAWGTGY